MCVGFICPPFGVGERRGDRADKGIGMRVLLIEDDSATAQSIELMLKSESFNVYITDLGEEGVDLGKLYDYDIILLDLNLPDMSGYDVLKTLRVAKVKTPILILSGLGGIEDKVRGLGFGADDYMTKPFHKDELVARINAIVRRSKGHAQSVIQTGDLKVNLDTKTVEVNGSRVHLTGKEYQMLELLSLRKGTTLTKEMFLNHLYGGMDEPELENHRRVHLQAPQEARRRHRGQELHRDGVGPRLRAARARRAGIPRKRLTRAAGARAPAPSSPLRGEAEWRSHRVRDKIVEHGARTLTRLRAARGLGLSRAKSGVPDSPSGCRSGECPLRVGRGGRSGHSHSAIQLRLRSVEADPVSGSAGNTGPASGRGRPDFASPRRRLRRGRPHEGPQEVSGRTDSSCARRRRFGAPAPPGRGRSPRSGT